MVSVWRCDGDGGSGSGCMAPTREPRLHPESPLFPTLLSLFFPLATTRGIPGWDLQDPANMRPIKATRPRLNLSFALSFALSLSVYLSSSLFFPLSLWRLPEAPVTTVSFRRRTCRFYRRGGIPVPSTGRRAGKCPADFSIGLSAE